MGTADYCLVKADHFPHRARAPTAGDPLDAAAASRPQAAADSPIRRPPPRLETAQSEVAAAGAIRNGMA